MVKDDEKGMHDGHRDRLLNLVINAGIDNVSNIQAVEFILTYIFPRGDTNPLAHRLLDKFGTVAGILSADVVELCTVPGIGDRAAKRISMLPEIFALYTKSALSKKEDLSNLSRIYDYCEDLLRLRNVEEVYIVGLNASLQVAGYRKLATGSVKSAGILPNDVVQFTCSVKPVAVVMVHNHPGGKALPSEKDYMAAVNMKRMFLTLGIKLVDSLVVGENGIYCTLRRRMGRYYNFDD